MYFIWDTERINNTKIYMLGYIIADESFNIVEKNIVIDDSIDLSSRKQPKKKKVLLFNQSIVCDCFDTFISFLKPKLIDKKLISVCFGKEEFSSLNDQLKLHDYEPIMGKFYDVKELSTLFDIKGNHKCNNLGSFASMFSFEHDAHNPLSDSILTYHLFKHLKDNYLDNSIGDYLSDIPNKRKVLDSKIAFQLKQEKELQNV